MKIITVTLNPAIDFHIRLNTLSLGKDNKAKVERRDNGGKGVNLSRALKAYGIDSICYTVLGEENGKGFIDELEALGIDHRYLSVKGAVRENINIHSESEDTVIATSGFSLDGEGLSRVEEELLSLVEENDVLCFCGRIPEDADKNKIIDMLLSFKKKGARLVLDSKSLNKNDLFILKPYLIKPNEEELFSLGEEYACECDWFDKTVNRLHKGGVENILVTLGDKGGILSQGNSRYSAKVPSIKAISTVGAGDSTIAGYLAGVRLGLSVEECFRLALSFGTAACLAEGSLPPDPCQIKTLLSRIEIDKK